VRVADCWSIDEKEETFARAAPKSAVMRSPGPAILGAHVNGWIRWRPRETENVIELLTVVAAKKDIVVDERQSVCL
jgi:hypothetical protein